MKNKFMLAVAVLVSATLITSCSIEKRHYMDGYHVEWKNNDKKNNTVAAEQKSAQTVAISETAPVAVEQNAAPVVENAASEAVAPNAVQENTVNAVASKPAVQNTVVTETVKQEATQQNAVSKQEVKAAVKAAAKAPASSDPSKGLLIVLCFLLPWLAVGLATDWDIKPLIINLLLSLTCIGAIIHALVIVNRNVK